MAGTIFLYRNIQVFVGAEDHLPPHVHAFHTSEGWRARFRFSFLSNVTGLYRFKRKGRRPTTAMLNELADTIVQELPACRAVWWATHGTICGIGLVNQRIETRIAAASGSVLARVGLLPADKAVRITAATYQPDTAQVILTLANGASLSLTAGKHIEEAKEW